MLHSHTHTMATILEPDGPDMSNHSAAYVIPNTNCEQKGSRKQVIQTYYWLCWGPNSCDRKH